MARTRAVRKRGAHTPELAVASAATACARIAARLAVCITVFGAAAASLAAAAANPAPTPRQPDPGAPVRAFSGDDHDGALPRSRAPGHEREADRASNKNEHGLRDPALARPRRQSPAPQPTAEVCDRNLGATDDDRCNAEILTVLAQFSCEQAEQECLATSGCQPTISSGVDCERTGGGLAIDGDLATWDGFVCGPDMLRCCRYDSSAVPAARVPGRNPRCYPAVYFMDGTVDCEDGSDEIPEPCCLDCRLERASSVDAKCLVGQEANDKEIKEQNAKAIIASTVLAFVSFVGAIYLWNYVDAVKRGEKKRADQKKIEAALEHEAQLQKEVERQKEANKRKTEYGDAEAKLATCQAEYDREKESYQAQVDAVGPQRHELKRQEQVRDRLEQAWSAQDTAFTAATKLLGAAVAKKKLLDEKTEKRKQLHADIGGLRDRAETQRQAELAQKNLQKAHDEVDGKEADLKQVEEANNELLGKVRSVDAELKRAASKINELDSAHSVAAQAEKALGDKETGFLAEFLFVENYVEQATEEFESERDGLKVEMKGIDKEINEAISKNELSKVRKLTEKQGKIEAQLLKMKADLIEEQAELAEMKKKVDRLRKDAKGGGKAEETERSARREKLMKRHKELANKKRNLEADQRAQKKLVAKATEELETAEDELKRLTNLASKAAAAAGRGGFFARLFGVQSGEKQAQKKTKQRSKLDAEIRKLKKYEGAVIVRTKTKERCRGRVETARKALEKQKNLVQELTAELNLDRRPRDKAKDALDKAQKDRDTAHHKFLAATEQVTETGKQKAQQNIRLRVAALKKELMGCPELRTPKVAQEILGQGRVRCKDAHEESHRSLLGKECGYKCDAMSTVDPEPKKRKREREPQHGDFIVWRKERKAASFYVSVYDKYGGGDGYATGFGEKPNVIELKINHAEGCLVYAEKYCLNPKIVTPGEATERSPGGIKGYVAETLKAALENRYDQTVGRGFDDGKITGEMNNKLKALRFFRQEHEFDDKPRKEIYLGRQIVVGEDDYIEVMQDVYPNTFKYILLFVFEFYDWMSDWQFYAINVNNDDRFHCSVQQDFGKEFKLADYTEAVLFFNVIGTLAVFPVELAVLFARLWLSQAAAERLANWVSSGMLISILLEDLPQLILQAVYFGATGTARFNLISGFSIFCTVGGLTISTFMSRQFIQNVWFEFIVGQHNNVKESEDGDFKREMWKLGSIIVILVHLLDFVSSWTFFARVLKDSEEQFIVRADMEASGGDYDRFHEAYIAMCVLQTLVCPFRVMHCAKHYSRFKVGMKGDSTEEGDVQAGGGDGFGEKSADLLFGPLLCVTTLLVDVPEFALQMTYLASVGASDTSTGYAASAVFTLMFCTVNMIIALVLVKRFVYVFFGPLLRLQPGPRSSWSPEVYRKVGWKMMLGIIGVVSLYDLASNWAFYEVVRDDETFELAWDQDVGYSVNRILTFLIFLCLANTVTALYTCSRILVSLVDMVPGKTMKKKMMFIYSRQHRQEYKDNHKGTKKGTEVSDQFAGSIEEADEEADDPAYDDTDAREDGEFVPYLDGRKIEQSLGYGLVATLIVSLPLAYLQNTYVQMQYNNAVDQKSRPYAECWLADYATFGACASNKAVAGVEPGKARSNGPNGVAVFALMMTACQMLIGIYATWGLLAEKLARITRTMPDTEARKYRFLHLAAWPISFLVLVAEIVSSVATYFFLSNSVTADSADEVFDSTNSDSNSTSGIVVDRDRYSAAVTSFFWIGLTIVLPVLVLASWKLMGDDSFIKWRNSSKDLARLKVKKTSKQLEYGNVDKGDAAAEKKARAAVNLAQKKIELKQLDVKGFEIGHALSLQGSTSELEVIEVGQGASSKNIIRRTSSAFEGEATRQVADDDSGKMPTFAIVAFLAALTFKHVPMIVLESIFLQKEADGSAIFALITSLVAILPSLAATSVWVAGYHRLLFVFTLTSLLSWISNWVYYLVVLIPYDGASSGIREPFLALTILHTLVGPALFWASRDYMGRRRAHKWRERRAAVEGEIIRLSATQKDVTGNQGVEKALDQAGQDGEQLDLDNLAALMALDADVPQDPEEQQDPEELEAADQHSCDLLWDAAGSTTIVRAYAAEFMVRTLPSMMIQVVSIRGGAGGAATSCAMLFGMIHVFTTIAVLGRWAARQGAAFLFFSAMHSVNAVLLWFFAAAVYEVGADSSTSLAVLMIAFCVWSTVAVPAIQLRSCLWCLRTRAAMDQKEGRKQDVNRSFRYDLLDGVRKLSEGPRPDAVRKQVPRSVLVHAGSIASCSLPVLILEAVAVHSVLDGRYQGITAVAILSTLFTLAVDCRVVGLWLYKQHPALVVVVSIQVIGLVFMWLFGGVCAVPAESEVLVSTAYIFVALATLVIFPAQFAAEWRQLRAVSTQSDRLRAKATAEALIQYTSLEEAQSKTDAGHDVYIAVDGFQPPAELDDIYGDITVNRIEDHERERKEEEDAARRRWPRLKMKVAKAGEALTQDTLTGLDTGGADVVKSFATGLVLKTLPMLAILSIYLYLYASSADVVSVSIAVLALLWTVAAAIMEVFTVGSWAYRHHFMVLCYYATEAANVVTMWLPVISLALSTDGDDDDAAGSGSGSLDDESGFTTAAASAYVVFSVVGTIMLPYQLRTCWRHFDLDFFGGKTLNPPRQGAFKDRMTTWFLLGSDEGADPRVVRALGWLPLLLRHIPTLAILSVLDASAAGRSIALTFAVLSALVALSVLLNRGYESCFYQGLAFTEEQQHEEDVRSTRGKTRGQHRRGRPARGARAAHRRGAAGRADRSRNRNGRAQRDGNSAPSPRRGQGRDRRAEVDLTGQAGARGRNYLATVANARAASMAQGGRPGALGRVPRGNAARARPQPKLTPAAAKREAKRKKRILDLEARAEAERAVAAAARVAESSLNETDDGQAGADEIYFGGFDDGDGAEELLQPDFLPVSPVVKRGYDQKMARGVEVNADNGDTEVFGGFEDGVDDGGGVVAMYGEADAGPAVLPAATAAAESPRAGFNAGADPYEPRMPPVESPYAAGFGTYEEPVDDANYEAHGWWFSGSKEACESRIRAHGGFECLDGSLRGDFLVRLGSKSPFVLCVRREKDVKPFMIRADNGTKTAPAPPYCLTGSRIKHNSLPDLVEYYRAHRINVNRETGLELKLRAVCPAAGGGIRRQDRPGSQYGFDEEHSGGGIRRDDRPGSTGSVYNGFDA